MKAVYGCVDKFIDVTRFIRDFVSHNKTNKLPDKLTNYNKIFTDPCFGKEKQLIIEKEDMKVYIKEDSPVEFWNGDIKDLHLIYVCNCLDKSVIEKQLKYLSSLNGQAKIHVEIYNKEDIESLILFYLPEATIMKREDNVMYFSLDYLHSLNFGYTLYCLAYDITRLHLEQEIFASLILNYKKCVDILNFFASVNKIAYRGSKDQMVYHNVFWVRNSYIKTCEKVEFTNQKPYYYNWLLTGKTKPCDCFSICEDKENIGASYYN